MLCRQNVPHSLQPLERFVGYKNDMTTKQKLREKINAACPELLKLKSGCEVLHNADNDVFKAIAYHTSNDSLDVSPVEENADYFTYNFYKYEYKILGTPPTLEHLLRAIERKEIHVQMQSNGVLGYFRHGDKAETAADNILDYDLTKPPLEQDEATQKALLELLS